MKIPNYDPIFAPTNGYRRGHTYVPADIFRMLICGPSNSGKTNILLHMFYELLSFDKVFLFSKNLYQNKYQALLQDFAENIEAVGDEMVPLEELPTENQKIVVFDVLVCEKNQNDIINYFINGRHRNCSIIYLTQTYYKVPKNIWDNCSHFCLFRFLPRENKRVADDPGVDPTLLDRATREKFSFLHHDKPEKRAFKNFDEPICDPPHDFR